MAGNGRWAAARDLPRTAGHTEGEENLAGLTRVAVTRNVGWLTVFGFSTENWVRPRAEVRHILGLHERLFGRVKELNELNVRIQWIGRPFDSEAARTPKYVQRAIRKAIADTAGKGVTGFLYDFGSLGWGQFASQAIGALVICTVIFGLAYGFFKLQDKLTKGGIRPTAEDEIAGLDLVEMGVPAYSDD